MFKGQTSLRKNIEDVLCPFTEWYCTQGAYGKFSHKGSEANDIRGEFSGIRYPYFAPVDVKCVNMHSSSAFVWWQSINQVRLSDGSIDYVTFLCGHDNTIDYSIGKIVKQGEQIGNMGDAGNATGVHCHIEVGRGKQNSWKKNEFGVYCIPNQIPLEKVFFMDNTNIISGSANWNYLDDIIVEEVSKQYLNISDLADTWRIYPIDNVPVKGNECGILRPSKFGGLSYLIKGFTQSNVALIETRDFGLVQIYIGADVSHFFNITEQPIYSVVA